MRKPPILKPALILSLAFCGCASQPPAPLVAATPPAQPLALPQPVPIIFETPTASPEPQAIPEPEPEPAVVWAVGSTTNIGGHAVGMLGEPQVHSGEHGPAVCFDGQDDGLIMPVNPLEGLSEFTIQVLFKPEAGGLTEQRFLHLEEDDTENRALVELRLTPDGNFYLDTFLRSGEQKLTLVDPKKLHPAGRWYWAALSYKDRTMRHYIDGQEEASGTVTFAALKGGKMSLGVRLNRVSWFKGCISVVHFTPKALPQAELQRVR